MTNWINKILLSLAAMLLLAGCSDDTDAPQPTPRAVLVYMVANNSLGASHYDEDDLNEMVKAAQNGALGSSRLFVYHHPRNATPMLKEITPDGENIISYYDTKTSSVSSSRMNEVIADFRRQAEADKYGLILWSHGSGWIENGMETAASAQIGQPHTLSFGDDGGRYMNVTTMANVLIDKGFDYIYFDCCYMAGVEVAYELRHCTRDIVASATELPAAGMPYDLTLRYLMKGEADLVGAAQATFGYYDAMSNASRTCTISVISTEGLDRLADATHAIYATNNATSDDFIPQRFMTSACYLYDFGQYVDNLSTEYPELNRAFHKALDDVVIYKASTPKLWNSMTISHHSGLSTYLSEFSRTNSYNYSSLQWAQDVASALQR